MKRTQAIIVGGGIGGLACALAFDKSNLDYIVLEQSPRISAVGSGLQIWSNGIHCLKELGLKNQFKEKAVPIKQLELQTYSGKRLFVLDFSQFQKHSWLESASIHRADLINILLKPLPRERIFLNSKVKSFNQDSKGVKVNLVSGQEIRGDFLVGADGMFSTIRKGIDNRRPRYAGYTCWRGLAPMNRSVSTYQSKGFQAIGKGSIFGWTPLKNNMINWFATAVDKPDPSKDLKLDQLEKTFSNWSDNIREIIKKTPSDSIVRHDIVDLNPKKVWGRGYCTLLGDSAHGATPNLAQGACMALESALVLTESLVSNFNNKEQALRIYEKKRYHRTATVIKESKFLGKETHCQNPILARGRNLVYSLVPADRIVQYRCKKYWAGADHLRLSQPTKTKVGVIYKN